MADNNEITLDSDYDGLNNETKAEGVKDPETPAVETITPEVRTAIEKEHALSIAKSMGYQTAEEMGNKANGKKILDPLTYITNAQEVTRTKGETIKQLESRVNDLVVVIEEQNKHRDKIVIAKVERKLAELKVVKDKAITDGDVTGVAAVEQKMKDLADEIPPETKQKGTSSEKVAAEDATLSVWKVKNPWFDNDPELRSMAQSISSRLGETLPIEDVLDVVDAKMARFVNIPEEKNSNDLLSPGHKASLVDEGGTEEKKTYTYEDLDHSQKNVYDTFKKQIPNFDGPAYIRDLVEIGETGK